MSKKEWVEAQIKSNKVVVFSKSYCPYCKMAKQALTDAGLKNFLVIELDEKTDKEMNEIQDLMLQITGARSVRIYGL
jgi:glutaredoxin 3